MVAWLSPDCKACKRLAEGGMLKKTVDGVKEIYDDAVFLAIDKDSAELAKLVGDSGFKATADSDRASLAPYNVTKAGTFAVIDDKGNLRYLGALDDDSNGKKGEKAKNYVVGAARAIKDGKKVSPETSKPYGDDVKK